jgi:hypothetical protein
MIVFLLAPERLCCPSTLCRFLTSNRAGVQAEPSPAGRSLFLLSATAPARQKQRKRNPQDFDGWRACQDGQGQIGTFSGRMVNTAGVQETQGSGSTA